MSEEQVEEEAIRVLELKGYKIIVAEEFVEATYHIRKKICNDLEYFKWFAEDREAIQGLEWLNEITRDIINSRGKNE
jgi:hypothetical protein